MMGERREVLCWNCRKKVAYTIKARKVFENIKGIDHPYNEKFAICNECQEEITVPGMDDENMRELDNVFRRENDLITVDEIHLLLEKYNIEKRPLSKLLGFGEITITRYLEGQLPAKKYSDMLRRLLKYDAEMKKILEQRKENITEVAYRKVNETISERARLKSHDTKAEAVALYIIRSCYEITNLSLQKLLYYFKAFGYVLFEKELLDRECEAWVYGPVFPEIYEKYKRFGKEVIQDDVEDLDYEALLSREEREVCDYVLQCFGVYNGSVLRELTHRESPWKNAREGLGDTQACTNVIKNVDIQQYFEKMDKEFDLHKKSGVENYIKSLHVI